MGERAPETWRDVVPTFAPRLRVFRKAKGWSLTRLAAESQSHVTALSKIEAGKRQPSFGLAVRLARALEVELCDFVERWPTRDRRRLLAALSAPGPPAAPES